MYGSGNGGGLIGGGGLLGGGLVGGGGALGATGVEVMGMVVLSIGLVAGGLLLRRSRRVDRARSRRSHV